MDISMMTIVGLGGLVVALRSVGWPPKRVAPATVKNRPNAPPS